MVFAFGAILVLLLLCGLLGRVIARLGLPDLIGFLAAGCVLGASGLGLVGPERTDLLSVETWRSLGDLGLAALMISAGLSMPVQVTGASWRVIGCLSLAILLCLVPAFLTAPLLMSPGIDPVGAASPAATLAYRGTVALAVAVTSVPFLTRILTNVSLLETPFGGAVLASACVVDIAVWSLFPALVDIRNGEALDLAGLAVKPIMVIAFMAGVVALAALQRGGEKDRAGNRALRSNLLLLVAAMLCLAAALWSGVGTMLASLAFGIFLSRGRFTVGAPARGAAKGLLNRVLIPLYFALVGAGLSLDQLVAPGLILGFLLWSSAIKMPIVFAAAAGIGASAPGSLSYALALNTRGGPGIVLGSLALHVGIIGAPTFLALLVASVVTAAVAQAGLAGLKRASVRGGTPALFELPQVPAERALGEGLR